MSHWNKFPLVGWGFLSASLDLLAFVEAAVFSIFSMPPNPATITWTGRYVITPRVRVIFSTLLGVDILYYYQEKGNKDLTTLLFLYD